MSWANWSEAIQDKYRLVIEERLSALAGNPNGQSLQAASVRLNLFALGLADILDIATAIGRGAECNCEACLVLRYNATLQDIGEPEGKEGPSGGVPTA